MPHVVAHPHALWHAINPHAHNYQCNQVTGSRYQAPRSHTAMPRLPACYSVSRLHALPRKPTCPIAPHVLRVAAYATSAHTCAHYPALLTPIPQRASCLCTPVNALAMPCYALTTSVLACYQDSGQVPQAKVQQSAS